MCNDNLLPRNRRAKGTFRRINLDGIKTHSLPPVFSYGLICSIVGYQQRLVECVRKDDGSYVNDKMCLKSQSKPQMKKACNTQPCAAE